MAYSSRRTFYSCRTDNDKTQQNTPIRGASRSEAAERAANAAILRKNGGLTAERSVSTTISTATTTNVTSPPNTAANHRALVPSTDDNGISARSILRRNFRAQQIVAVSHNDAGKSRIHKNK